MRAIGQAHLVRRGNTNTHCKMKGGYRGGHSWGLGLYVTHLHYLIWGVCLVVVEESFVYHMTGPLPMGGQLHHLRAGAALGEALHRRVLQDGVVSQTAEEVHLGEPVWVQTRHVKQGLNQTYLY